MAVGDVGELVGGSPGPEVSADAIRTCLTTLRRHLDMDIGFVSRFRAGRSVIEYVDSRSPFSALSPGDDDAIEVSACGWVAHGRLPELMPDVRAVPAAAKLPTPRGLPVGAQVCVPLHRASGVLFGTLCCISHDSDPRLRERDLELARMFAGVVEVHLETLVVDGGEACRRGTIEGMLRDGGPRMAMEPVVHVESGRVRAHKAVPVFPQHLDWDASRWLAEADLLGLGPALETAALRSALRALPSLPTDSLLAVTISAATLLHPEVVELLTGPYALRLVVELTAYAGIEDFDDLADPLAELRAAGVLLAMVEEGAGWAALEHIERLQPEVLILPARLVHDFALHPARQAIVEVLVGLARRIGAEMVAEGVAAADDLEALTGLGIGHVQGPVVGAPVG